MPLRLSVGSSLLLLALWAGCSGSGGGGERVKVYRASGKVTMSGGAVANASVTFSPQEKQPVATGLTDNEGNFTLTTYEGGDGAAAGDYVAIVTKSVASSDPTAASHEAYASGKTDASAMHSAEKSSAPTSGLPEKYSRVDQSDLKATVTADGDNVFNLELKP